MSEFNCMIRTRYVHGKQFLFKRVIRDKFKAPEVFSCFHGDAPSLSDKR